MAELPRVSNESAMEMGSTGTNVANAAEMADNPAGSSEIDRLAQTDFHTEDVKLADSRIIRRMLLHGKVRWKSRYVYDEIFLRFESLERSHIHHLQEKLVGLAESDTPWDMKELGETLHQYSTALRDLEYMRNLEDYDIPFMESPFVSVEQLPSTISVKHFRHGATKLNDPLRRMLNSILPTWLVFTKYEADQRKWVDQFLHHPPHSVTPFVDNLARFIVAFVGGLSLVVPMIIMRIHQNTSKSLITTSVAVLLFAATVSVLFKASNSETLGITAAYAAVLVVFVGTSS